MIRPIVKYHGGKGRLFKWILGYFPDHKIYIEPFGGAASLLLNKTRAETEVYNELDELMFNLMLVARDQYDSLYQQLVDTKYEKNFYEQHRKLYQQNSFATNIDRAATTYIVKRMSRGGLCGTFSWSSRIYSTGPAEVHSWNSSLMNLRAVHLRLQGVTILNENALDIIPRYDTSNTLFYFDPPYLHETRSSPKLYDFLELSNEDHQQLATLCRGLKGRVIVSGYPSPFYDEWYAGWRMIGRTTANHSSQDKCKPTMEERLWMNF